MNWEELKEESENLIKKDGFVAIEKDEWKWIVDKIESLALENVRLKDEIEDALMEVKVQSCLGEMGE